MTISHTNVKKAEAIDTILSEDDDNGEPLVRAFWAKGGVAVFGSSPAAAIKQMQAAQKIYNSDQGYRILACADNKAMAVLYHPDGSYTGPMTPVVMLDQLNKGAIEWVGADTVGATPEVPRSDNGVALDGAVAYSEGTPSGDNPFSLEGDEEEYKLAEAWDAAWDAAADAVVGDEPQGGSVVSEKYRAKYIEAGHPTHCGDWLATTLNDLCLTKKGTDMDRFEAICALNGVDISKYRRDGTGWQGRLRMTGRNLLAKRVYMAGGKLLAPNSDPEVGGTEEYTAPTEWMETQRYKMPKGTK